MTEKIMEEQVAFRSSTGCEEQIFVMRQLAEKGLRSIRSCMEFSWIWKEPMIGVCSCGWCCRGMVCQVTC